MTQITLRRLALEAGRHRHAEARRNRGRRVRRAEGVVVALGPLGEAVEPARLADRADLVAPAGDDLVRVGLVPNVPDQAVARGVEHVMEGNRQLDHAKPRTQMAAGHRHRVDGLGPQLLGNLLQLLDGEIAQVFGALHAIQMRRLRHGSLSVAAHRSARRATRFSRDQHDKITTKGMSVKRPVMPRAHRPESANRARLGRHNRTSHRLGEGGLPMYSDASCKALSGPGKCEIPTTIPRSSR